MLSSEESSTSINDTPRRPPPLPPRRQHPHSNSKSLQILNKNEQSSQPALCVSDSSQPSMQSLHSPASGQDTTLSPQKSSPPVSDIPRSPPPLPPRRQHHHSNARSLQIPNESNQSSQAISFHSSTASTVPHPPYSSVGYEQPQHQQFQYSRPPLPPRIYASPPPTSVQQTHSPSPSSEDGQTQHLPGGGYTPVEFDEPSGDPIQFYGNLIDPITSRPSEVFARLADSLFFWIDANCSIRNLRGTGVVEPAKYAWIMVEMGEDAALAQILEEYIHLLYEAAGIACQYQTGADGRTIAILDRRGWLHSSIFDACSDPEESWKYWVKAISHFSLVDPATSLPFPAPLPRSALPALPTPALQAVFFDWQRNIHSEVHKKKTDENAENARRRTAAYGFESNNDTASAGAMGGGYMPVNFDGPQGNVGDFYGKFIDPVTSRPSGVYTRLVDSFFFWIDSNCDIPGLRNTGFIEPAKCAWIIVKMGSDAVAAQLVVECLQSLYESAGIPCQYQRGDDGQMIAVLDRRGWLHSSIFDTCADPEETWKYWSKAVTLFALVDPATSLPFPSPLPRSAFPTLPIPALQRIYTNWKLQTQVDVQKKKTDKIVRDTMAAYGLQSAVPSSSMVASSYVGGVGATNGGLYNSGAGTGTSAANMNSTIKTVATLATTALGLFGGGGAYTYGN